MTDENLDLKQILQLAIQNHKNNNYLEAAKLYEKILNINPNHFESNFYLGTLNAQNSNFKKASDLFNKAIEINPKIPDLHNNLGLIYREMGELEKSSDSIKKAIQINPMYAEAHNNLGLVYKDLGQTERAEKSLIKSIEIKPNNADPHNNLGLIYKDIGQIEKAKKCFNKSIEINHKHVQAYVNLGNLFKNLSEIEKSEKLYEDAININPKYFEAYNNLMDLLERTNQNKKLENIIIKAEAQFKSNPIVKLFYGQYLYKTQKFNKAIENLEKIKFNELQLNRERLRSLILAKSYDKLNQPDNAFEFFKKTNQINQKTKPAHIDKSKTHEIIRKRISFFNKPYKFEKNIQINSQDKNPVFLIGFPRSGTTLLDTILRSHKSIGVIEEENLVGNLINSIKIYTNDNFENLEKIDTSKLEQLKNLYHSDRNKYLDKEYKIIIDKMPLNIFHIAEIIRIFPNAKFIVALRHPCDCVLSCYMQSFKMNNAMSNFLNLKDSAYLYSETMKLWLEYKKNINFDYIEIKYENIVSNFKETISQLLSFLKIEWSDEVLNFYKTAERRSLISTPSYDQVNKPIYSDSVEKWKKYEKHMSDIIPILNLWIEEFKYQ